MKILVIRRDNIGDLVCTTPLIRLLRQRYPEAWIAALVTRYNAEVLAGNPDLNAIYAYQKAKHRAAGESRATIYWQRLKQVVELRRQRLDLVILPATGPQPSALRLARLLAPVRILTQAPHGAGDHTLHEVEHCIRVLRPLGIAGEAPALVLRSDAEERERVRGLLAPPSDSGDGPLVAVHVSARKPSQRWPADRLVTLMRQLHQHFGARFLLLWSPGDENNRLHPGDDRKAAAIAAGAAALPLLALPTAGLRTLIAGLALADTVICSDGGAMHLAAGLGKPIVCFFGNSNAARWRPWGVPYVLLQPQSRNAGDISVEEALTAYGTLVRMPGQAQPTAR